MKNGTVAVPFRPLTKAQNTKKENIVNIKSKISGEISRNFYIFLYFFAQNEPRLTVLSTAFASVRLVCTLSQQSAKLMTRFVISLSLVQKIAQGF